MHSLTLRFYHQSRKTLNYSASTKLLNLIMVPEWKLNHPEAYCLPNLPTQCALYWSIGDMYTLI